MPTYEYRCEQGHRFEEFQSMVEPPLELCPVCGARAERLISGGTGLIFKGSGFYITDYGRGKSGAALSSSGESSAKSEPKPSAPKPESKSD